MNALGTRMDEDPVTQVWMEPRAAVKRLGEEGVVHGLDDAALDALRKECWDDSDEEMEDAGVLGILTSFYESVERGAKDGFVWRGAQFWNDTDDVVAEIASALGKAGPIFRQTAAREGVAHDGTRHPILQMTLERDDGEAILCDARRLADVVELFNKELRARRSPVRLIALDTSGEWEMFIAIDLALARRLAIEGVLPVASRSQIEQ